MLNRLLSSVLKLLPDTKLVPDDGTVILSIEDIHRHRMVLVGLFGLITTTVYTCLQIVLIGFGDTGFLSILTGLVGITACVIALKVSLWGDAPEPYIRWLLIIFSTLLWVEVAFSGGVTGYHAAIFPVLPVIGALLMRTRSTIIYTSMNLAVILGVAWLGYATELLPTFSLGADMTLIMSTVTLLIAVLGCGGCAIVMSHQNERIEGQLRDLVEYQTHLAAHDHLSGLGNRIRLQERFDQVQPGQSFDLLLIDLDGFKAVNDTYGHNAGDYLITALSERLREVTDNADLLVRLGGDEFVILLEDVEGSLLSVRKYAEYLIDILSRPYPWEKHVLRISASIGHARFPHHGHSPSKVLSLADKALYDAKDAGKSQCVTHGMKPAPKPKRKDFARSA